MFKERLKAQALPYSVIKSASLSSESGAGTVLVILAEAVPQKTFLLKTYSSSKKISQTALIKRFLEGILIYDRVDAFNQFEQLVTELEYSDLSFRVDDADDGSSFISSTFNPGSRPTPVLRSDFSSENSNGMVFQLFRGGVRALVIQDVALGLTAYQLGDGEPKSLDLDPGARAFLEEMLARAGSVSAALEVWLNRSAVFVTDIAFRTINGDFTGGSFIFRMKAISQRLPSIFFQGVFDSHIVLPQKYSERTLQVLNPNNVASPVMYLRSSKDLFSSSGVNCERFILDSSASIDGVIMQHTKDSFSCLDVVRDELVSFASPSLGLSGSVFISGVRADSRIRPAVF